MPGDCYFRYDPDTGVAHVLVLTTPGNTASVAADNAWVKVYDIAEDSQVDGTSADFAWIYDGDTPVDYEAAFPLPLPAGGNDIYDLVEVHLNVGGATSSTGKHNEEIGTAAISLALSDGIRDDIVVNPDGGSSSGDDTGDSSSGGDTDSSGSGGDTGGSSGGDTLTGDPDDDAGDGTGGLLSCENCDSRSGEIGRRISIGRSGFVTVRYVQCD